MGSTGSASMVAVMVWRYLFGDDVFISYSRRDGAAYAAALANALSRDGGLTCFLDQWGASASTQLSRPVLRALDHCRVLVLIGTPNVGASVMVRQEISRFSRRTSWALHRPIIPIAVDGGLAGITWSELEGLHRVSEPRSADAPDAPSPGVVKLVCDSCTFTTRNQRVRRLSWVSAGLLLASLAAGGIAIDRARAALLQEQAALDNARRATLEQERAEQQARLAESRQLTASAALLVETGNRLPEGVRLALQAMQSAEEASSVEVYQVLRRGLSLLPRLTSRLRHDGPVRLASLSADARVLATAAGDTVRVWDLQTRRALASRRYEPGTVSFTSLSISPDASLLAVGYGGVLQVFRVPVTDGGAATGGDLSNVAFTPALRQPQHPTFSPDGRWFAAIGYSAGLARVWSIADGAERATHRGGVALGFSPDGEYLFVAGHDRIDALAVTAPEASVATISIPPDARVAFSEDGAQVAAADFTSVRTWRWAPSPRTWQPQATLTHQGRVTAVAVSSDGDQVSVASADGTARIWRVSEQREVLRMNHDRSVTSVQFSRDGSVLATAGEDGDARLWETGVDHSTVRLVQPAPARAVVFGAGETTWTIGADGHVRSWGGGSRGAGASLDASPVMTDVDRLHTILAAAFEPTGRHAAVAVSDGTVFLWDLTTGEAREWIVDGRVRTLAVGPRGQFVALAGERFELWMPGTGADDQRQVPLEEFDARALAFSPDGRFLAAASDGIRIVDLERQQVTRTAAGGAPVQGLVFSADSAILAMADADGGVRTWRWRESEAGPQALAATRGATGVLAFGDGDRLLAYAAGRDAVVHDVELGRETARITHDDDVTALAFSDDGRRLGTVAADGVARLNEWRAQDLVREAQRRLSAAP